MDFNAMSFDEIDEHVMTQLLLSPRELVPILKGHLIIEKILEALISKNMSKPSALFNRHRLNFDLRVDLASALGLISDKYVSSFKALNKIRNNYAHNDSYTVTFEELSRLKFDWIPLQEKAFSVASSESVEEAAQVAIVFLCWKAIYLLQEPAS